MSRLQEYSDYVLALEEQGIEDAPDCKHCKDNRGVLEEAWQVVAQELYDPTGRFSQALWAEALLQTLKEHNGVLRSKAELYKAAASMFKQIGDPYTEFMTPERFRKAQMQPLPAVQHKYYAAQFVGIGLEIGPAGRAGGRQVLAALAGSPAEGAGIMRGDRLLAVDGVPVADLDVRKVEALLRGPDGSLVTLRWASSQAGGTVREADLERRYLPLPAVRAGLIPSGPGGGLAYIRLHYWSGETTQRLRELLSQYELQDVSGYVIDLRNNPGGEFEEALAASTLFLAPGATIAETVRDKEIVDSVWVAGALPDDLFSDADLPGRLTTKPVVLLVNRSTASASEVFTGALHDNGRAWVLGERTFGKGVVQYFFRMEDGSGAKVTMAKYLTPLRHDITRMGGLEPDARCSDFPHVNTVDNQAAGPSVDTCMLMAIDILANHQPQ